MNIRKSFYYLLVAAILTACSEQQGAKEEEMAKDTFALQASTDVAVQEEGQQEELFSEDEYLPYHIVVLDTSFDYSALRNKMKEASEYAALTIDTMDRTFDKVKNAIDLPDDYEDEMYAGEYYPRLHASQFLSIEYLHLYKKDAAPQSMAVVAGIYEEAMQADSLLELLKPRETNAFVIKALLYNGCMH
jgi:hypothetical protein